jgi:hypothetical protein
MGVHCGSNMRYRLSDISFSQVCSIARNRAEECGRANAPAVAFDISWLCYFYQRSAITDTVDNILGLVELFLKENVQVYTAFDPEGRNHSKKAPIARHTR